MYKIVWQLIDLSEGLISCQYETEAKERISCTICIDKFNPLKYFSEIYQRTAKSQAGYPGYLEDIPNKPQFINFYFQHMGCDIRTDVRLIDRRVLADSDVMILGCDGKCFPKFCQGHGARVTIEEKPALRDVYSAFDDAPINPALYAPLAPETIDYEHSDDYMSEDEEVKEDIVYKTRQQRLHELLNPAKPDQPDLLPPPPPFEQGHASSRRDIARQGNRVIQAVRASNSITDNGYVLPPPARTAPAALKIEKIHKEE